jgi:hypothetical protein
MSRKLSTVIGKTYGRLTVIGLGRRSGNNRFMKCVCRCGKRCQVLSFSISQGATTSCGCYKREMASKRALIHGECRSMSTRSPEWMIWNSLRQRINNPRYKKACDYSQRGLKMAKRWDKYENFISDVGRRPNKRMSLGRINNDRGYFLSNCRWETSKQQMRNQRRTEWITFRGETLSRPDWADRLGISSTTLKKRLVTHPKRIALTVSRLRIKPIRIRFNGVTRSLVEWAKKIGVSKTAFHKRLRNWSKKDALTTPPFESKVRYK